MCAHTDRGFPDQLRGTSSGVPEFLTQMSFGVGLRLGGGREWGVKGENAIVGVWINSDTGEATLIREQGRISLGNWTPDSEELT